LQPTTPLSADDAHRHLLNRLKTLVDTGKPEITVEKGSLKLAGREARDVAAQFGTPLYVYSERILRTRCREIKNFIGYEPFMPNYSCKANTNVALLKIIRSEGFHADAMSPGEIFLLLTAGFRPEEIFFVSNYVDDEEMRFAIRAGVTISVDSLAQLERYGRLNPGGRVAVRINPGIGDGHHEKVITGGAHSKFGIFHTDVEHIFSIAKRYNLTITGLNQHIGSNYLTGTVYLESVKRLLSIAENFADLDFIDFGGGMGIPYKNDAARLNLATLGEQITEVLEKWTTRYGKRITAKIEPGRYVVAESGLLLITVHALKQNPGITFAGTDGGFNVLARPMMYGAYHEILNTREVDGTAGTPVTVCGNICESGDILGENRRLSDLREGDVLAVLDAGAYGFSMSSNYNSRLRPAEVLITEEGQLRLIRERDRLEDLLLHQIY